MSPERITTTTTTTLAIDAPNNLAYWLRQHHKFAAHVKQLRTDATGPQTKPEHLTTARHADFLRVPLENQILWGFKSDLYAQRFVDDFGGEILPMSTSEPCKT